MPGNVLTRPKNFPLSAIYFFFFITHAEVGKKKLLSIQRGSAALLCVEAAVSGGNGISPLPLLISSNTPQREPKTMHLGGRLGSLNGRRPDDGTTPPPLSGKTHSFVALLLTRAANRCIFNAPFFDAILFFFFS